MTEGEKMVWAAEFVRKYHEEISTAHDCESHTARHRRALEEATSWARSVVWAMRNNHIVDSNSGIIDEEQKKMLKEMLT
jgi:hypothetical protein